MTKTDVNKTDTDKPEIDAADLDLVDDDLADEDKSDAEIFDELEAEEIAAADVTPDDESGAESAAAEDAAKPDDDEAGSAESGDKSPDEESSADELWATATPEQQAAQAQIKKLEQSDRSSRGRLGAMQRQINELSRKPDTPPAADDAAGDDKGEADATGYLATENWKSFKEEYPEVAGPVGELLAGMQATIDRNDKELAAIGDDRRQHAVDEQQVLLEQEHSDWHEVISADEGAPFESWLNDQPRHIREAGRRNAKEIVDAAEAADLVSRFKAFRSDAVDEEPPADEPKPEDGKGTGTARLSDKRQRQLATASSTRTGGLGAAHGIPEDGDPQDIWNAFDKKDARQRQTA